MRSITGRKGWFGHSIAVTAAMLVAGLQFLVSPAWAGYELPPGERITNLPHIPRSMPQKEAYEIYDPVIGRNFDIKNFWMRADLRVRPEFRNNVCFGGNAPVAGVCNSAANAVGAVAGGNTATNGKANDFYVQQWVRLGIGYDLSPDVNFYFELIDSANWGSNGVAANAGNAGDPLNHDCGADAAGNCRMGVRAAYVLVRNLAGVQGLSMKAGRQYVIFGNHSLFGHFDWANTGYSHDGIMFQYATKAFESHLGWFRNSEGDLSQGSPVGSLGPNVAGVVGTNRPDGSGDVDMFIFYNQVKNIPGILFEPYYVLYLNNFHESVNSAQGTGTPKFSSQTRHMVGQRTELRKGGVDAILETAWQFGQQADGIAGLTPGGASDNTRNLRINAWALRSWLGYTVYDWKMKPRLAINVDYASGDGDANCNLTIANNGGATTAASAARCGGNANTFENFFPTNHIHMGYADVIAWRNMVAPQANLQLRPTERDHVEIWYMNMNLANARDNWYRGAQGPYIFSRNDNTKKHIGDEWDITWTRMFADGKVAFQATYGHIFAGSYIAANTGQGQDQSWGFVQLWMNF